MRNKYPIYIISKGRYKQRYTVKSLQEMGVDFKIVIEPSEYKDYVSVIDKKKILVLPTNFSEMGQGSIPVRNWVWEHSIQEGHQKHWILDDNIKCFRIYNRNRRIKVNSGVIFRISEDFVDRYENIMMSGFQYTHFCPDDGSRNYPYMLNTRIYSCILLDNSIPLRWRGKYNEDTDLSLRILKRGWCTCLFYIFLCDKVTTMTMEGGNTDTIYNQTDNRYEFVKSLMDQHPDITKITKRYGRYHHQVDYSGFRDNKLIKKKGIIVPNQVNNYGLTLKKTEEKINN